MLTMRVLRSSSDNDATSNQPTCDPKSLSIQAMSNSAFLLDHS